jgi:hypothetical protein
VKARFLLFISHNFMNLKEIQKKVYPVELFTRAEHLVRQGLNRARKILKRKLPPLEDVLFVIFFLFSITFGVLLFGIGEKIKNEKPDVIIQRVPSKLEREISQLVSDRPIQKMVPYIASQDKDVAAYLVAIAKKESDWGKYSPKKDGKECYNYWGYRGTYNQTRSGYSCFDSPRQAVRVVGERIGELIDRDINTPGEMVVWKCGWTCAEHSSYSVDKWIQDVDMYYRKF